ncbi:MAG TPA: hypothetical protein VGJ97_07835 [Anaerolineaceae bacterium]|jgi:hypothetical protein
MMIPPTKPNVLMICGSLNPTTMLHQTARVGLQLIHGTYAPQPAGLVVSGAMPRVDTAKRLRGEPDLEKVTAN